MWCTFTLMRLPLLTVIESEWQHLQPFIQMGRKSSRMCRSRKKERERERENNVIIYGKKIVFKRRG